MEGVQPTLSELQIFVDAPEEYHMHSSETTQTSRTGQALTHSFSNGDCVQVCRVPDLRGKIISIDEDIITIMPENKELKDALKFQASKLQKYFKQGDHVRVRYNIIRNL